MRYYKKRRVPLFILTTISISWLNANPLIDDFLQLHNKTHYQHSTLKLEANSLEYIDKIRVDTQYSQDAQQQGQENFAVRVYPKDFDSYDLEKQNFNSEQSYLNTSMDRENIQLQEQNYKLLVDAKFQKERMAFLEKTIELYNNQLQIKRKLMDDKFYVESIFFMNHKIQLLKLKLQKQKQLYRSTIRAIALSLNERYTSDEVNWAIESYSLVDSSGIIQKIQQANFRTIREQNIDTQLDNEKAQLIQEQLKLEKMKEEFSFDFIEAGYKNKQNQGNSFSIGIGVDLPLKSSNQIEIMKEKLALVELNEKDKVEDSLYLRQAKLLSNEAKSLYEYENGLREVLENDTFYNLYSKKEDADQRFILEVQERDLDSEEELISVQERLHQVYIQLLVLTHGFNESNLNPHNSKEL